MTSANPFGSQEQSDADRLMAEFREQPTLCLTLAQAARLCQLDAASAAEALDELTRKGYLRRVGAQSYSCETVLVALGC
jgi:DNA-binding IclR family transcriptional regulator